MEASASADGLVAVSPPAGTDSCSFGRDAPRRAERIIAGIAPRSYRQMQGRGLTGQLALAHQVLVHRAGALAAFADRPDDEGLAAAHVAAGEDLGNGGAVV